MVKTIQLQSALQAVNVYSNTMNDLLAVMVKGQRCRPLKRWGYRYRERDVYMLMLRVDDWKLERKTEVFQSLVPDIYAFPHFHHITLYGPFTGIAGETPDAVFDTIEDASRGIPGMSFNISGYLRLKSRRGQAVTHRVVPSDELIRFHEHIWRSLTPIARSQSWIDHDPCIRQFHITHGYNLRPRDANRICDTIRSSLDDTGKHNVPGQPAHEKVGSLPLHAGKPIILPDYAPLTSLRVIVLKNGIIGREFDLPAQEWLNRPLVYNRNRTAVSMMQYRKLAGLELASRPQPAEKPPFILSDLHLGHNNIIRYCRRPFRDAGEMDRVLIGNWNRTVGETDEVIYLGDFRYSPEAPPSTEYRRHLNGRITFVLGNHDTDIPDAIPSMELRYNGNDFLFIHNPDDVPPGFNGWVVHGHYHNNNIERFPFVNFEARRINVSCELTGYRPVSLETIDNIVCKYQGSQENIGTLPVRLKQ
jgi:calcineurin-like phosphoesterase family protein